MLLLKTSLCMMDIMLVSLPMRSQAERCPHHSRQQDQYTIHDAQALSVRDAMLLVVYSGALSPAAVLLLRDSLRMMAVMLVCRSAQETSGAERCPDYR